MPRAVLPVEAVYFLTHNWMLGMPAWDIAAGINRIAGTNYGQHDIYLLRRRQRLPERHRNYRSNEWRSSSYVSIGDERVLMRFIQCRRCSHWNSDDSACRLDSTKARFNDACPQFSCDGVQLLEMVLETMFAEGRIAAVFVDGERQWIGKGPIAQR